MAVDIKVPSVGESITEGTPRRWLKPDGASSRPDEPLFELETDKATPEVVAPAGRHAAYRRAGRRKGADRRVVGRIDDESRRAPPRPYCRSRPAAPDGTARQRARHRAAPAAPCRTTAARRSRVPTRTASTSESTGSGRRAPPRKTPQSVKATCWPFPRLEQPSSPDRPGCRDQLWRTRDPATDDCHSPAHCRALARRRSSKRRILTTFNEVGPVAPSWRCGPSYKERFEKKHGVSLGFMSFFVKAAVARAARHSRRSTPASTAATSSMHALLRHRRGRQHRQGALGAGPARRRHAVLRRDRKGHRRLGRQGPRRQDQRRATCKAAPSRSPTAASSARCCPRRSSIRRRAASSACTPSRNGRWRVDGHVVIRPMMYLALTYDHRLIDGREAVQFLGAHQGMLENPERLLLDL